MNKPTACRCRAKASLATCLIGTLEVKIGDEVVYHTTEGMFFGQVICLTQENETEGTLARLAGDEDREKAAGNAALEREAYLFCRERVGARNLPMNLVSVERLHDGSKMIFYFTADGRVDFRALVKDLAGRFRCRVEMRQIGVRNETKILGGIGSCGRELCCCTFMKEFSPVSVKMAKEQNLSLNPNKISGLCGRLMCCLAYEFPVYMEAKKDMPRVGRRVHTPEGDGKVVRQNVMARRVAVIVGGREFDFDASEISPAPPPQQNQPKGGPKTKNKAPQGRPGAKKSQPNNKGAADKK